MTEKIKQNNPYNIPTLALRGLTIFPQVLFHFDVGRTKSIKALERAMESGQRIFLVGQKNISVDSPSTKDLYKIGTVAKIRQILKISGDNLRVLVEGECRATLLEIITDEPYLKAIVEEIPPVQIVAKTVRDKALLRNAQELFLTYSELVPKMSSDIMLSVMDSEDIGYIADYIAQNTQIKYSEKQKIIEKIDPRQRISLLIKILAEEIEILAAEMDIQGKVKEQMDKNQRDYFLREQIKAISEELGEGEDAQTESQSYIGKIYAKKLPQEVEEKLLKEASRLGKMQVSSPESGVIRTYLDTCLDLPWNDFTKENNSIESAKVILDADHFGMDKVKERILEFFAVKKLTNSVKGQIICLVGPPGVGKTSVARSIARAMGRSYARISLGGVRDEADIRGHRKTYIGAMPGRIIVALKQAKSRNCLILVDEIDKLGADAKGDPSAALLEVFDTEQNVAFRDHFIELPFDLSDVMFVTTANNLDTIPVALRDRMEIIELVSYTDEEKLEIAKRHILPKQIKKHGLKASNLKVSEDALRAIISDYIKESGVRTLERQLAKLCRKTAKYMVETEKKLLKITTENMREYMGIPRYKTDKINLVSECGVVNGLAWTSVGGEILEVEAMAVDGSGKVELTGNLGDVMKESVKAAMTFIRSRAQHLGVATDFYSKKDLHIHFPEGAVPKDGPSAGIATATAIISALTGEPVLKTLAMTGEITLRGRVLPIGGLKEKTMAALRYGVSSVIIPTDNLPDLEEIDQTVRSKLHFDTVSHMDQVVEIVFGKRRLMQEINDISLPIIPAKENIKTVRRCKQ